MSESLDQFYTRRQSRIAVDCSGTRLEFSLRALTMADIAEWAIETREDRTQAVRAAIDAGLISPEERVQVIQDVQTGAIWDLIGTLIKTPRGRSFAVRRAVTACTAQSNGQAHTLDAGQVLDALDYQDCDMLALEVLGLSGIARPKSLEEQTRWKSRNPLAPAESTTAQPSQS